MNVNGGYVERQPQYSSEPLHEVYWGSHGCELPRGHEGHCACDCCECKCHPDPDSGCVAKPPYYGPDTKFYGKDAP